MPTILKKTFPCQAFCFGPLKKIGDYTPSFFQQASKLNVGFFRKRKKVYKPKFCSFNVSSTCNLVEAFTNIANFPIMKIRCVLQNVQTEQWHGIIALDGSFFHSKSRHRFEKYMKREDGLAYLMMRANQSDMSKNNKRIESSLDMASWSLINPTRFDSNFLAVLTNYDADSPYGTFP